MPHANTFLETETRIGTVKFFWVTEDQEKTLVESIESLNKRIDRQNELLHAFVRNQTSFKGRFVAGLWTGFGTVFGATVLVSALILMLKPLSKVDWIGPVVNRVVDALENRGLNPRHRVDRTDQTAANNNPVITDPGF